MRIPEPLFGLVPVVSSVPQVEAVCVNHYPESATRPHIWEGFQFAHTKIVNANTPGKVWLGGDFVVDSEDPNYAQVHLRVPAEYPKNDSLLDLLSWFNDKEQTEKLACDLSALVEFPPDDPAYSLVSEYAEIVLNAFTAHGDRDKKGFPIIPLP
jgi:hypothetical protein